MATPPNKLLQFWQELKRRNVIRVVTVYAGAAFVILELVSMSKDPFGLPDWTFVLAVGLLSIGFFIAVILSWIYDLHPEDGMVRTEPPEKVKSEDIPKPSNSWKIASYISFIVIMGLILLNILPRIGKEEILEKSIAVLPFSNESSDQENTYFINGMMESILNNLCRIEELRVVSRNSVEHYRNNPKPTPVVAKEMGVSYVLEGSGQKVGNRLLLTVQLIVGNEDRHIWSKQYDRMIKRVEDLIDIQLEIAELVVDEIEAVITPEERAIIENVPTINLTAYDFYQRAREEHTRFWLGKGDDIALRNAISLYESALDLDSSYAQAYTGLAMAISDMYNREMDRTMVFSEVGRQRFQDSVLSLIDIALHYDNTLEEAYFVKAQYYSGIQEYDQALEELNKAIDINPNYSRAYSAKSWLLLNNRGDWIEGFKSILKAVELEKGPLLQNHLMELGVWYEVTGFQEKSIGVYDELLSLSKDTAWYCKNMAGVAFCDRDWGERKNWCLRGLKVDSSWGWFHDELVGAYLFLDNIDSAYYYAVKANEMIKSGVIEGNMDRSFGHIYWKMGKIEEANQFLDPLVTYYTDVIESGIGWDERNLILLSNILAFRGQRDSALAYLNKLDFEKPFQGWIIIALEEWIAYRDMQSDPAFQEIVDKLKTRWQEEHRKLRSWLYENDML